MQIGKGAECRSQGALQHNSLLFLKDQCDLALLSQAPCHLDTMKDYYCLEAWAIRTWCTEQARKCCELQFSAPPVEMQGLGHRNMRGSLEFCPQAQAYFLRGLAPRARLGPMFTSLGDSEGENGTYPLSSTPLLTPPPPTAPCVSLPPKYSTWLLTHAFASPSCLAPDARAKLEARAAIAGLGLSKAGEQGQELARLTGPEPGLCP